MAPHGALELRAGSCAPSSAAPQGGRPPAQAENRLARGRVLSPRRARNSRGAIESPTATVGMTECSVDDGFSSGFAAAHRADGDKRT